MSENSENLASFQPSYQEDSQFKYTITPHDLIRNPFISPQCKCMIIYLSANAPNWRINAKQLISHYKEFMGRDQVYATINEAIEHGYMKREVKIIKGLKRITYHVSSDGRFKKSLPLPENQDTENQDNKEYQEEDSSSSCACAREADASAACTLPSEEGDDPRVKVISQALCENLGVMKILAHQKDLEKTAKEILCQIPKETDTEEICKAIKWAFGDIFWAPRAVSSKTLAKSFENIYNQYQASQRGNAEERNRLIAHSTITQLKKTIKKSLDEQDIMRLKRYCSILKLEKRHIANLETGQWIELNQPEQEFKQKFSNMLSDMGV
jgi:hypothetical protein